MKDIGNELKKLRKQKGLSVETVSDLLKSRGFDVRPPTIYGYENNHRSANADVFLAMCELYDCKNILEVFSDIEIDPSRLSDSEWELVQKYREIDSRGKRAVDAVLEAEYQEHLRAESENQDMSSA